MAVSTTVNLDEDDPKVGAARDAERTAYEHYGLDAIEHYLEIAEWGTRVRSIEVGAGPPLVLICGGGGQGDAVAPSASRARWVHVLRHGPSGRWTE